MDGVRVIEGPRGCGPAELPGVIRLVDGAMRQGSDQTMLTDYPLVYAADNLVNVSVVLEDGLPVATAPVLPRRVKGDGFEFGLGVISPTATDSTHQHRGHGSRSVVRCVDRMAELGLEASVLWTQVATFPFYELNGWQAVERHGHSYRLSRVDAGRFGRWRGEIRALAGEPSDLAAVLALHEAYRDRMTRSPSEAARLFSLPKMTTWLAIGFGGRVAGYLLSSVAMNKPGLLEAGGDRDAIAGLVHHVLNGLAPEAFVDLHVGFAADGLEAIAADHLLDCAPAPFDGNVMIRINDVAGLMRAIWPWLAARMPHGRPVSVHVPDAGVTVSFEPQAFGIVVADRQMPDHLELTRRELTSVLFGSHPAQVVPVPPAIAWMGPFRLPIHALDRS